MQGPADLISFLLNPSLEAYRICNQLTLDFIQPYGTESFNITT